MKHWALDIAVLAGDGIGVEIMPPCIALIESVLKKIKTKVIFNYTALEVGAAAYLMKGCALSDEDFAICKKSDAILLGAMGLPEVRYPNGTEISPQIELREKLQLFAGVRPIKAMNGLAFCALVDDRAADINFILVRESTEGLFAGREKTQFKRIEGEASVDEKAAVKTVDFNSICCAKDSMVISREGVKRVCDFAFNLAQKRQRLDLKGGLNGSVTCVDKSNVLGSMAFFRHHFWGCANAHQNESVDASAIYVDAAAQKMVMAPWDFDVVVTENMFGDILSELGAGLIGGVGFAPSADIGEGHAVFQPCHGSAPDIAGKGIANPVGMILSACMMLDWLGEQHNEPELHFAATLLERAVSEAFVVGELVPAEHGGDATTQSICDAVEAALLMMEI